MTTNRYDQQSIRELFDQMASTYGHVHLVSSLGLAYAWRRQVVEAIGQRRGQIADFMSAAGEVGALLRGRYERLHCIDLSTGMIALSRRHLARHGEAIAYRTEDATECGLPARSMDAITCAFGIKTLDGDGRRALLGQFHRILKPGGIASILEISVPRNRLLAGPFQIYGQHYVPLLGRLFLGTPDHYRRLWEYTRDFTIGGMFHELEADGRWQVEKRCYLMGSAVQYLTTPTRA